MLKIRPATINDAEVIARGFLAAMWMTEEEIRTMMPICRMIAQRDDTLYSWRNAHIAEVDGQTAAVLICYDGAEYGSMADVTFRLVRDNGGDDFTQMNHEAEATEWYVDTLAVFPAFRRQGIATALLHHAASLGRAAEGIKAITLYVDPEHPWVVNLYKSVGFVPAGENVIFNQVYEKMEIRVE